MSKNNPVASNSVNLFPVIGLLVLNLVAVLFTLGAVLSRTAGLSSGSSDYQKSVNVDRIGDIRLVGEEVVFDLIDIDGDSPEVASQVTISQEGFVRGFTAQESFLNKLIDAGKVKINEDASPEE